MSPSAKWKRRSPSRSATRSDCMSMPYTSQSVAPRMRLERWWPMKPLTPIIRMRLVIVLRSFVLDLDEAQDFTIAASGEPFRAFPVRAGGAGVFLVFQSRPVYLELLVLEIAESSGK